MWPVCMALREDLVYVLDDANALSTHLRRTPLNSRERDEGSIPVPSRSAANLYDHAQEGIKGLARYIVGNST